MGVEHLGAVTSEMLKHGVRGDFAGGTVRWPPRANRKRSQARFRILPKKLQEEF